VAKLSEINTSPTRPGCAPGWATWAQRLRPLGDAMTKLHPLRMQRQAFSDMHPARSAGGSTWHAMCVRTAMNCPTTTRCGSGSAPCRPGWKTCLNLYRDLPRPRHGAVDALVYGPMGIGAWLPPEPPAEQLAAARAQAEIDEPAARGAAAHRRRRFCQAVCRIVLAGMVSIGSFERRSFRLARLLADLRAQGGRETAGAAIDWRACCATKPASPRWRRWRH
jgi:hypothetical protein